MIIILPLILMVQLGLGIAALSGTLGPVELWHIISHLFGCSATAAITGFTVGRRI